MSPTSYKKNGDAAATPVWWLPKNGNVYVWTSADSVKAKRLRRDPRCTVAPCDALGKKILGDAVAGRARFLEGPDAASITAEFRARYGFQFTLISVVHAIRGHKNYTVIEITPC